MFSIRGVRRATTAVAAATVMLGLSGTRAWAQDTAAASDPNPGAITITGNIDFLNQYMFRGIRQNSTGMAIWPSFDLGLSAYSGEGGLKSVGINFGTWNSLHTGDTGQDGPSGKLWYESDFYASLGFGFGGGTSFTTTYTAYTSPNNVLLDGARDHVQAGRGRQRQAWQGGGEAVCDLRVRGRYRRRDGAGRRRPRGGQVSRVRHLARLRRIEGRDCDSDQGGHVDWATTTSTRSPARTRSLDISASLVS